jgi:hypothetical protein
MVDDAAAFMAAAASRRPLPDADSLLRYHAFAEGCNYGPPGDVVRAACWAALCRCGAVELRSSLASLPLASLASLLCAHELWVRTEAERATLACDAFEARARDVDGNGRSWASAEAAAAALSAMGWSCMRFEELEALRDRLEAAGAPSATLSRCSDALWEQARLHRRLRVLGSAGGPPAAAAAASASPPLGPVLRFAESFESLEAGDGPRHGTEVSFAGSLWKLSAALSGDGGRALSLFLHRRPCAAAAGGDAFIDRREEVSVRYQLAVASRQLGDLDPARPAVRLPPAPKGWGWRAVCRLEEGEAPLRVCVALQLADEGDPSVM